MDLSSTQEVILRIGLLIAGFTLLLTASFIGLLTTIKGQLVGYESRVAWYVVTMAVVFVVTIIILELNGVDGKTIIVSASVTSLIGFILLFFSAEGVIFALRRPDRVLVSQLILYFFAAALVATGVGFWGVRHWREFTSGPLS